MNKKYLFAIIGTVAMLNCQITSAQNLPGATTITLAEAYYHFDTDRDMESNGTGMPNAALAYNFDSHWALEAGIGVLNAENDDEEHVHGMLYTLDAIYRFIPDNRFVPYVIGGVGVLGINPNGTENVQQGNFNAGVGTEIFFNDFIALRIEARDIQMTTGSGLNDFFINGGISFVLGGNKPVYKDEPAAKKMPKKDTHGHN